MCLSAHQNPEGSGDLLGPKSLGSPKCQEHSGPSRIVTSDNPEHFSAIIKPYIDSSDSKEGGSYSFAQWPLVKVVRLYIKSELLKDGIVLVDLPGSMDTNAARGAIAETYQKDLSVTCVVATTSQAASDKPVSTVLYFHIVVVLIISRPRTC